MIARPLLALMLVISGIAWIVEYWSTFDVLLATLFFSVALLIVRAR